MFADNERDARAAYHRWLGQGPSGPYAIDFIEAMTDKEREMMERLAAFMFRAGAEFKERADGFKRRYETNFMTAGPDLASAVARATPSATDPLGTGVPLSGIVVPQLDEPRTASTAYVGGCDPVFMASLERGDDLDTQKYPLCDISDPLAGMQNKT